MKNELVYKGEKEVKYLFQKSYKYTSNLVVVFSGIPPVETQPKYNYIKALQGFDCNKLFILDDFGSEFGARASYYLCENKDYSIERSVIALINHIVAENNIKEITSVGSSKGGFAALYFGIKYGFKYIIAGSPQFYLGEYLLSRTKSQKISEYMVGNSNRDAFEYLNNLLPQVIQYSNYKPNIFLYVGKGEYHNKSHVQPLVELLKDKDSKYTLEQGDYNRHEELTIYFPNVLKKQISDKFELSNYR